MTHWFISGFIAWYIIYKTNFIFNNHIMKKLLCAILNHKWLELKSPRFFGHNKLYECQRCGKQKSVVFGKETVL
jgi:hypothetical protein